MHRLNVIIITFFSLVLITGCSALQTPSMPSASYRSGNSASAASSHLNSAVSENLIYATNQLPGSSGNVLVFSYPKGLLIGTLSGFVTPMGECVDNHGNVFITDAGASAVLEFAHGGTAPIAELSDPGEEPVGCAVDSVTGNLAVTNFYPGNIAIYQNARGTPSLVSDPQISTYRYCAYDTKGNLYADGDVAGLIAMLPVGSGTFMNITLSDDISPGSMQWHEGVLAVVDTRGGWKGSTNVDQIKINGSIGTIGSTTMLESHGHKVGQAVQYWISGKWIFGPARGVKDESVRLAFWRYPRGGKAIRERSPAAATSLWGVTLSPAQ